MKNSILKEWLLWSAETINESVEINNFFKQHEGKKMIIEKIGQFLKLTNNAVKLPKLIVESHKLANEWKDIAGALQISPLVTT